MTTMTPTTAARRLARGCANHSRITILALNDADRAERELLDRMRGDMRDAVYDTPDRDDTRAEAGRYLNDCNGPLMMHELRNAAKHTIEHIRLLNAPRP